MPSRLAIHCNARFYSYLNFKVELDSAGLGIDQGVTIGHAKLEAGRAEMLGMEQTEQTEQRC